MVFLSVGYMYYLVNRLPIPLTDSERVTTRFLILPLVFLFVLGAIRLEAFLRSQARHGLQLLPLSLGWLALAAHDLFQHSRLWRFTNMYQLFPNTPVQLQVELVQRPDPLYFMALWGGGGVALLAFLYLLVKVRQESARMSLHERKELPC
jgi:hypothetical protein